MCNLYRLKNVERWEIAAATGADQTWARSFEVERDYVAPGGLGYVVRHEDGRRVLDAMRWGYPNPVPGKAPVTNIRNYISPFWHSSLTKPAQRCLVPVTSFQEWSVEPNPESGKKKAHWFSVPSRRVFTFAGAWRHTDKGPVFAFLTCGYEDDNPAAHIVGRIYPKACPVILHKEDEERWLTGKLDRALSLAWAYPSQLISVE
ncbi:SOS response-associated peptidase family protein [Rhizorhabdus sp.]|jgi:putative SOS response-associated peptidase YedK|uniref:SOS response-associated peptidase family protein n=1 Tax=Rhizorhabdus sp. TaxID=1968843 RepID=UPI0019898EA7|nr:SOS response-associated peptidase family protein [Rhizorhabdus sp.]MBD3759360.1 SOS response-associated peptidase family protein [Rhizorhabdus sp.]